MRIKQLITLLFCNLFAINSYCQSFVNGDLDGIVNGPSCLPTDWQNVPYTDVNCLALNLYEDSPDLTDINGPGPLNGTKGNPFSGTTFISGQFGTGNNTNHFWQEGIMQTVTGFTIEETYTIRFHQTVTRNLNALDKSGSWAVYIDTVLAGITDPTYSNEPVGSLTQRWEARSITFTARATTHLIKFLPMDDDTNYISSTIDTLGALRMGLDSIAFVIPTSLNEQKVNGGFSLFPNPNNGTFSVLCYGNSNFNLVIYDNKGAKVYEEVSKPNQSVLNIDISNSPKGLYYLLITNEKNRQNIKITVLK
ncbi:MAG TPA: T9SS type A sorting domain-containing protein [Bacteroidia bacterium]|nr:T9SS type A sorting domain-containing protein [Bacteroidia bacterium]